MASYKKYESDEQKVALYQHRVRQAQAEFEKWEPQVREAFKRYENRPSMKFVTGNGHRISSPEARLSSTPSTRR